MPRRLIVFALFAAVSTLSTGCCGRIRQCIANRWSHHHGGYNGACCTPAFKVPGPARAFHGPAYGPAAGCATCAIPIDAGPIVYGGPVGQPRIGAPTPLLHQPMVEPVPMTPTIPPKGTGP